jgi:predicted nucleic acid-binding protein
LLKPDVNLLVYAYRGRKTHAAHQHRLEGALNGSRLVALSVRVGFVRIVTNPQNIHDSRAA